MTSFAASSASRSTAVVVLRWLATFPGFPLGGLAAMLLVGPVDSATSAIAGGLVSGAVLGLAQAWGLGLDRRAASGWVAATATGFAVGLAAGAAAVGYGTDLRDLALQGGVAGLCVGAAQGSRLAASLDGAAIAWPAYLGALWAMGWTLTYAVGVQVDEQFTVFGAAGAVTVTALTSVLPLALARRGR